MSEVLTFAFAENATLKTCDVKPLELFFERFSEALPEIFQPFFNKNLEITCGELRTITFDEWKVNIADLTSLATFRILPLRGWVLLRLEANMIGGLLESHFGGQIGSGDISGRTRFRNTELRLAEQITNGVMKILASALSQFTASKPVPVDHQSSAKYLKVGKPAEQIFTQAFGLSWGAASGWKMELVLSQEAAENLLEYLETQSPEKSDHPDPFWQERWWNALQHIHLPIRTIVAQPNMTMPQLFSLSAGDVIPIAPRAQLPIFVADRKFAIGTMGEKSGNAAFKIDQIQSGETR